MSTIFDYLDHVTYDSIYDRPFKEHRGHIRRHS